MTDALFGISIAESIRICKDCGIFKGECCSNKDRKVVMPPVSDIGVYSKYVSELLNRGEYDILLDDNSMFQFAKSRKEVLVDNRTVQYDYYRYSFIQSTTQRMTFEDYCNIWGEENDPGNVELLLEMYEHDQDVIQNHFPLYLRYDVDLKGYLPNSHSYAHLHIGFKEGYRMPVSLILTPRAFVCMVLKLVCSDVWKDRVVSKSNASSRVYCALKGQCNDEKNNYWNDCEKNDLFIG